MKTVYIKLTVLFLISIIPVASFNYFIDPYGIFNNLCMNLWYELGYEPNQHYAKMRHLINDKHSWDSYLFGASRAGKINPDLIPDGNYYNMNYSEGLPGEHLVDIKVLLEKGVPLKNVIIGLDNFSYTMRPEDHYDQMMRHPYDASDFKRYIFQIKYLYSAPRIGIINNIRSKDNNYYLINFNILGNGMQNLERVDKKIERDIERHIKGERFNKANIVPFGKELENKYMNMMDETIRDIVEIIELSKKYRFNLYFFINPTYYKYYIQDNPYHFLMLKKKLAQITNYRDFSGFNTINNNSYYYYETSHYRIIAGDLIACRMINCANIKVPEDFGVFITKENVDDHIKKQNDELIAYKTNNWSTIKE
jgi:hypothetical protein